MSLNDSVALFDNTTVTAGWNAKTYTVTINPNGASGSAKTYSVAYGNSFTFPSCPFTRSGYNFKGYATSSSGSASYQAKGTVSNITSNKSYYCVWANALAGKSISLTVDAHYQSNSNFNWYILQCSTISPELYGQVLCVKPTNFSGVQQDVIHPISLKDKLSLNKYLQTVKIGRTSGSNLVRRGYLYFWFKSKGESTAVSLEVGLNERDTPITLTY